MCKFQAQNNKKKIILNASLDTNFRVSDSFLWLSLSLGNWSGFIMMQEGSWLEML